jgi:hypothetical protein
MTIEGDQHNPTAIWWNHGVVPGERESGAPDRDTAGLVFGEGAERAAKTSA